MRAIGRAHTRPHLYLRGSPVTGFVERLRETAAAAGAGDSLHILLPAAPFEMERLAARYDLGLAGEPGHSPNRRIALTNKIFSYLLAGLPVVMSDIQAHRSFAPDAGRAACLYRTDDADSLAAAIDSFLDDPAALAVARTAAFGLGQTRFNWDAEKSTLVSLSRLTLGSRPHLDCDFSNPPPNLPATGIASPRACKRHKPNILGLALHRP